MNKAHRSLWNSSLGAWVAVSENTHARGKKSHRAVARAAGAASLLMLAGGAFAGGDGGGGGYLGNGSYGAGRTAGSSTTGEGGHGGRAISPPRVPPGAPSVPTERTGLRRRAATTRTGSTAVAAAAAVPPGPAPRLSPPRSRPVAAATGGPTATPAQ
ncbi:ESPR domain-containing protein [Variovorax boronicumulans]